MSAVGTPEFRRKLDKSITGFKELRRMPDFAELASALRVDEVIAAAERLRSAATETPQTKRDLETFTEGCEAFIRITDAVESAHLLDETIANLNKLKRGSLDPVTSHRVDNIIATATRVRSARGVTPQVERDVESLVAEAETLRRLTPLAKPKRKTPIAAEARQHAGDAQAAAADVKRLRREADAARREYVKFEGDLRVVDHYTGRARTPSIKDRERSQALHAHIDDLEKQHARAVMRTATAARAYSKARYGTVFPKIEQAARTREREALRLLDALRSQSDSTKRGK